MDLAGDRSVGIFGAARVRANVSDTRREKKRERERERESERGREVACKHAMLIYLFNIIPLESS